MMSMAAETTTMKTLLALLITILTGKRTMMLGQRSAPRRPLSDVQKTLACVYVCERERKRQNVYVCVLLSTHTHVYRNICRQTHFPYFEYFLFLHHFRLFIAPHTDDCYENICAKNGKFVNNRVCENYRLHLITQYQNGGAKSAWELCEPRALSLSSCETIMLYWWRY